MSQAETQQKITNALLEQMAKGTAPWRKPWEGGHGYPFTLPKNGTTGNRYNGINIPILWSTADQKGYATHSWATYKQWEGKGKQVRRGEKGTTIVYYDTLVREKDDQVKKIPFLKTSAVFNEYQLDGFEQPQIIDRPNLVERLGHVEQFIANTGARIQYGGDRAFYHLTGDYIQMPKPEAFLTTEHQTATEAFFATEAHELTHLTGAKGRCDRQFGKRFGDHAYAFEELVAEIGSAFFCAELGITDGPKPNHADYLANWMEMGKQDAGAFFKAASEASKAFHWMEMQQAKGELLSAGGPQ